MQIVFKRYIRVKIRKGNKPSKRKKARFHKNFTVHHYDDSRPPPYDTLFGNSAYTLSEGTQRKVINGREYLVVDFHGGSRLIPVRTPSALLYKFDK